MSDTPERSVSNPRRLDPLPNPPPLAGEGRVGAERVRRRSGIPVASDRGRPGRICGRDARGPTDTRVRRDPA